jgi:hypothetical protein
MARKRARPTAAPMMLGVLRFMVFSVGESFGLMDEGSYCTWLARWAGS